MHVAAAPPRVGRASVQVPGPVLQQTNVVSSEHCARRGGKRERDRPRLQ